MVLAAIDVETTGVNILSHEILELSIVLLDKDFKPTGSRFTSKMKPLQTFSISEKALEINGLRDWKFFPEPAQVRRAFVEWKEELVGSDVNITPLGHNYDGFDKVFLYRWLGDLYHSIFHYRSLDSQMLARVCSEVGCLSLDSTGLRSIAGQLNLPYSEIHDSYGDALLSATIYNHLITLLRSKVCF